MNNESTAVGGFRTIHEIWDINRHDTNRWISIGILSTDFCSEVEKNDTVDGTEIRG